MCVVKLTRSGQLPVTSDGRIEAAKVRESGGKCESVQHLRDASTRRVGLALVTPVTCGQGVLEAVRDGPGLDGQFQVEILYTHTHTHTHTHTSAHKNSHTHTPAHNPEAYEVGGGGGGGGGGERKTGKNFLEKHSRYRTKKLKVL